MRENFREMETQKIREYYIEALDKAENATRIAEKIADDLFSLDLTVYSKDYSFDSLLYNCLSKSALDSNYSLHPEQLKIIEKINNNEALIVSAPTSFGKTFCIFEYIARYHPQNIVLIVPTLALVDEYIKKIIKKYTIVFNSYRVHTQIDVDSVYDFSKNNIFVLTHDRVVQDATYQIFDNIDLLVVDEVYKLETNTNDDRVLVLNMAYYYLSEKAKKYILLAPFINNVNDKEKLNKKPIFYKSSYSPVVNKVITKEIVADKDRYPTCQKIIGDLGDSKTLVYFPAVTNIYAYVNNIISREPKLDSIDEGVRHFIEWAKNEIHNDWSVVKALERGYAIHNGQMSIGIRLFQLNLYEENEQYNKLLCTSTLLEGVNTKAKNIIITKPTRGGSNNEKYFSAFDFFNLVGRTGRLNEHFVGDAYYIKSPSDPLYEKLDAIKSIQFEITDNSEDVDIQTGNFDNREEYLEFLSRLGIEHDDYIEHIGSHFRFETVKNLYSNYLKNKEELLKELSQLSKNDKRGRFYLVNYLYRICEGKDNTYYSSIINSLINRNRLKIKKIVDDVISYRKRKNLTYNVDRIISDVIRIKTGYIEHQFYSKLLIIKYFMELDKVNKDLLSQLDQKVIYAIEQLYFSNSKQKKMLLDFGIYERDIDKIAYIIGEDYEDVTEMKSRLIKHSGTILSSVSFISSYVINNLL